MLGLRSRPRVHVALTGALVLSGGCKDSGKDTETDTDTDSGTGTDTDDTTSPTTTLSPTTLSPTTEPPPPPPVDTTPPALVAVEFVEPQILRLSFTEALASVEQVNPKRFRLSLSRYQPSANYYYGDPRTNYYELELINYESTCEEVCYQYGCYEQCSYDGPRVAVEGYDLLPGTDASQALLLLTNPVFPVTCNFVEQFSADVPEGARGGLLLHYASGGTAQITDTAGLALPSMGIEWIKVDDDFMTVYNANFPDMNPFLPIPCPF